MIRPFGYGGGAGGTDGSSGSAAAFVPTGSNVPDNGLYLPGANQIGLATNSTSALQIDASQKVLLGHSAALTGTAASSSCLQSIGTTYDGSSHSFFRFSADTGASNLIFNKSRNAAIGSHTALQSGDQIGVLRFGGSDGTDYQGSSTLLFLADGNFSGTSSPGRLEIYTTKVNSTSGTLALKIDSGQNVVVGGAALSTTATSGFPWIPSCPGTPTGAPAAPYANAAAMVVDTSNNRLYVRVGSTWKYASLT